MNDPQGLTVPQMGRPTYNGLRGDEWFEVLVSDFRKMLQESPAFTAGICHHSPRYMMRLRISSSPYEAINTEKFERKDVVDDGPAPPGTVVQTGEFEKEHTVRFPDLEREQAGLVVPDLRPSADGSISDFQSDPFVREVPEGVQVPAATPEPEGAGEAQATTGIIAPPEATAIEPIGDDEMPF